ncbi:MULTISPECIES: hypothetical protein [unclassified Nocardioides]|uniref:hypothetical protein n=1 Tax=unclassified Nocardioides TaxID=2615069 RepID=UPI0006F7E512|nr:MULTISPECIES: hypothetical protein [unclassified Nocardioides]KRA28181.1 hypothetical protein ASD81_23825 [Nocardioides sp. Root614]KRA86155.1 hypothetical protein ASD84_24065 [Nocardioides sp. Root682]
MKRIVRRLLVAATAGSLLSLAPVSAAHAATVTVVNGFAYPAPLGYIEQRCTPDGVKPALQRLYRQGGTVGTHATGMGFSDFDWMAGVQSWVPDPTALEWVSFSTYHPEASLEEPEPDGYYRVLYDPSGNHFDGDYYEGYFALDTQVTGWGEWSNMAAAELVWRHLDGTPVAGASTLAEFAANHGGNGSGAYIGFEFGCDARDYYMDEFTMSSGSTSRTYDFEGALSRTYISATATHFSDDVTRDLTRLDLIYGQDHHLLGDGTSIVGGGYLAPGHVQGDYVDGVARLYERRYGSSVYVGGSSVSYLASTYAGFHIHPARQTYYQIRSLPSSAFEASSSKVLLVTVKRRVRARAEDTQIRRGRTMVVTGTIFPQDAGVTVRLQRLVDGRWRTLSTRTTTTGGKYRLTALARTIGRKRLRVHVVAARGNLANVSPSVVITVVRNPAPTYTPVTVINSIPVDPPPVYVPGDGKPHAHRVSTLVAGEPTPVGGPVVLTPPPPGVPVMQGRG